MPIPTATIVSPATGSLPADAAHIAGAVTAVKPARPPSGGPLLALLSLGF